MAQTDRIAGYVGDIAMKLPCRVATTAPVTLSGLQTIDGVLLVAADRVLVKDQADPKENGIYIAATGAWSRASDFDGARDVVKGTQVEVTDGTVGAGYWFNVTSANPIVVGTNNISFAATTSGPASAAAAAASAAAALVSEGNAAGSAAAAAADALLTAADVVSTNADVVQTGLDAVATAADRAQTGLDAASAAASAATALTFTTDQIASGTHAATSKATPVDADEIPLADSAASFVLKKLTWANLKATVKAALEATGMTFTGPVLFDVPADIASAATVDLTGIGSGTVVNITGTTAISAFTMGDGQFVKCVAAGALPLTYNATTNKIEGGVSVTLAAGHTFDVWKKGSVIYTCVQPITGTSTATAVCGTSGTIALGNNALTYQKNGGMTSFGGYIDVSSVSSPTGSLKIVTGIPYVAANNTRNRGAVSLRLEGTGAATGLLFQGRIDQGTSDIYIASFSQSAGTEGTNMASLIAGGTQIELSGHFFTE